MGSSPDQSKLLVNYHDILTIPELIEIVRKTVEHADINITKYEIKSDRNAFGYLGEYFRLTVYVKDVSAFLREKFT